MHPLAMALVAALLFGASTPASKLLLRDLTPSQLAGLLYLGAALATGPLARRDRSKRAKRPLDRRSAWRLAGAVLLGGLVGPVLVLLALRSASSASVALLLNLETAATAALGVLLFRERMGACGWLGVATGLAAAALLAGGSGLPGVRAGMLVALACLAWGLDNHWTALIDGLGPAETTTCKGLVAGAANLLLGLALAPLQASWTTIGGALVVGALSYGASIVLYVLASHHLGATRAQVAFSSAPFLGAGLSFLLLGEPCGPRHGWAGALLAVGVVLLFLDRHEHTHTHPALEHVHSHRHDDGHHDHVHPGLPPGTRHTHLHRHEERVHRHRHLPDLHPRHTHREQDSGR